MPLSALTQLIKLTFHRYLLISSWASLLGVPTGRPHRSPINYLFIQHTSPQTTTQLIFHWPPRCLLKYRATNTVNSTADQPTHFSMAALMSLQWTTQHIFHGPPPLVKCHDTNIVNLTVDHTTHFSLVALTPGQVPGHKHCQPHTHKP